MEEEKAAAYYDELTRKGQGAARFKQGLGFSAASDDGDAPARGSALVSSSSSFLSSFVRASSPSKALDLEKQSRLESIQNKLRKKKETKSSPSREEERREARASRRSRSRSRSRERKERERDRRSRRRSRSRSRERYRDGDRDRDRDRDRYRDRRRRRSRSRSDSGGDRRRRERRRSRSSSPRDRRAERRNRNRSRSSSPPRDRKSEKKNGAVDYSRLIEGYEKMSQAERVKAKMKLQLAETVEKDEKKGSSGWERFEFNKDAPLDDEEIQAAEDDTSLVKHIGQSFRLSAVQEKREQKIRDAHDEAIFGVPVFQPPITTADEVETKTFAEVKTETETSVKESNGSDVASNLFSEKVLAKQQGSWRDRARGQRN